jgi:hypothetical protein
MRDAGPRIPQAFRREFLGTAPLLPSSPPQGLEACPLLQVLLAPNNLLQSLEPRLLAGWPLLQRLELSGNRLSGALPQLPPMPRLESLLLSDNAITGLHSLRGAALPLLACLDISFNGVADLDALAALSQLPALSVLQLHDNPLCSAAGYTAAVAVLLPWLSEVDRSRPGERGEAGRPHGEAAADDVVPAGEGGGGGPGGRAALARHPIGDATATESAAWRAARAAASDVRIAGLLRRRLAASPGCSTGETMAQRVRAVQQWLPALQAATACGGSECSTLSGAAQLLAAAGTGAEIEDDEAQQLQWSLDTWAVIAETQAREQAALATLKARCCEGRVPQPCGAAGGAAAPAWLETWCAETRAAPQDAGCPELAATLCMLAPTPPAAEAAGAGERHRCKSGGHGSSGGNGNSGTAASAATTQQGWLQVQEAYEGELLALAHRHLRQLLQPPSSHQTVLAVHGPYSRRLAGMRETAAREAAATALQAAWRGCAQRAAMAALTAKRWVSAALVLQAAWRGHSVRAGQPLRALQAAEAVRQREAATVLQAHARGWVARRRLAAALSAARRGGRPAPCGSSSSSRALVQGEDSLIGFEDDYLDLSPELEAELLALRPPSGLHSASAGRSNSCSAAASGAASRSVHGNGGGSTNGVVQGSARARETEATPSRCGAKGEAAGLPAVCPGPTNQRMRPGSSSSSSSGGGGGGGGGGSGGGRKSSSDEGGAGAEASTAGARAAEAREARLEAKLRGLMVEWGFADLATAMAYHK